jgi:hypothetical protein
MTTSVTTSAVNWKKIKFTRLQMITGIYGLFYLVFFIASFFPSNSGNPTSDLVPYHPFDLEQILNKLLFLLFLTGFYLTWKHEALGGLLLIFTFIGMCCVSIFILAPMGRDFDTGIILGFPLLVLGVLYM